jgi:putative protein-disulfide isomerase
MCSWCWGYRPTWLTLKQNLPEEVKVIYVVGGLAPDTDEPMPAEQRALIASYWQRIADELGAEFNFDFWTQCTPRRSTYPACRGVISAALQGGEEAMIEAIQHAYYLRAMNPSDTDTLVYLAAEIGLDEQRFAADLASTRVQQELERNFELRRSIDVYSFPSLVLTLDGQLHPLPLDYKNSNTSLKAIQSLLADDNG